MTDSLDGCTLDSCHTSIRELKTTTDLDEWTVVQGPSTFVNLFTDDPESAIMHTSPSGEPLSHHAYGTDEHRACPLCEGVWNWGNTP